MKKILFILITFLVLGVGYASAFPLYNGTASIPGTKFEDNDLEYFIDNDGDGLITVGDFIYSALEFDRIIDNFGGSPAYVLDEPNDELVGIARIQYLGNDGSGNWLFGEIAPGTPMVDIYTGGVVDAVLDTPGTDPSWAAAMAAITEGTYLWSFSIDADPDTFWFFSPINASANDPATLQTLPTGTLVGSVNFQLNQVGGADIFDPINGFAGIGGDGMTDLRGSGTIETNTNLTGGAFAVSDFQAFANPNPIPEPTTMALFGIGLLSLAAAARRRES